MNKLGVPELGVYWLWPDVDSMCWMLPFVADVFAFRMADCPPDVVTVPVESTPASETCADLFLIYPLPRGPAVVTSFVPSFTFVTASREPVEPFALETSVDRATPSLVD